LVNVSPLSLKPGYVVPERGKTRVQVIKEGVVSGWDLVHYFPVDQKPNRILREGVGDHFLFKHPTNGYYGLVTVRFDSWAVTSDRDRLVRERLEYVSLSKNIFEFISHALDPKRRVTTRSRYSVVDFLLSYDYLTKDSDLFLLALNGDTIGLHRYRNHIAFKQHQNRIDSNLKHVETVLKETLGVVLPERKINTVHRRLLINLSDCWDNPSVGVDVQEYVEMQNKEWVRWFGNTVETPHSWEPSVALPFRKPSGEQ